MVNAEESKIKAGEAVTKLKELHENLKKISEEKSSLERELKIKEREFELLRALQERDAYNQVHQEKIAKKRIKIRSLRKELQSMDCKVQFAMQEVKTQQVQLVQAWKELKKQNEKVIQLQKEKEELARSYNIEKERVNKLMVMLFSNKEQMQVITGVASHTSIICMNVE